MKQKPFLIIQTGTISDRAPDLAKEYGDLDQAFIRAAEIPKDNAEIVRVYLDETLSSLPDTYCGILITGSPLMITAPETWMDKTAVWLRHAIKQSVPILGVCFGHQLLAYALGGIIGRNPNGLEAGTATITMTRDREDDLLFNILPQHVDFHVHHYESVLQLPPNTKVFGMNSHEAYHAVRYAPFTWGIQFHPELDPEFMRKIMQQEAAEKNEEEPGTGKGTTAIKNTPFGPTLLQHFYNMATPTGRNRPSLTREE